MLGAQQKAAREGGLSMLQAVAKEAGAPFAARR
jgi:hypothetical protein